MFMAQLAQDIPVIGRDTSFSIGFSRESSLVIGYRF
jgi:hypothetical protein